METKRIIFETEVDSRRHGMWVCTTKCPNKVEDVYVGSWGCEECDHHVQGHLKDYGGYVICSH